MINKQQHIDLITGYLQNTLTDEQLIELRKLVESGEIDRGDLNDLNALYNRLERRNVPEPSATMRNRFYEMLEQEKKRQETGWRQVITGWLLQMKRKFQVRSLAYVLPIFLAGLLIGDLYTPISKQDEQMRQLSLQVNQLREIIMINLLDDSSPFERMKAVNISTEMRSVDSRVTQALLHTLNNDSNINVRLAAVEALVWHGSHPEVRRGLVNAIPRQESPIVQAALADAMLQLQERQSVDELKKLLDRNELDSTVRNKLEHTIAALNSQGA